MIGNSTPLTVRELRSAFCDKTVIVTGHTGFKGAWLAEWLLMLGAHVIGVALPPETEPSLFLALGLADRLDHRIQDIRDGAAMERIVEESQPDYLFHLAAQPLVRLSYSEPVATYATNVHGTVHVLNALLKLQLTYNETAAKHCAAVFITSDKCYSNREWSFSYREDDILGGYDPYSSSKACAELAIASFRQSFFNPQEVAATTRIGIASARAGNVIAGGDWSQDRIVPDCVRHLQRQQAIQVRNPGAIRPWQHVLEPLFGYLLLALRQRQALETRDAAALEKYASAFNFGPETASHRTVECLVHTVLQHWPGAWERQLQTGAPHEARNLQLACEKAFQVIQWRANWTFEEAVKRTIVWYRDYLNAGRDVRLLTRADIEAYMRKVFGEAAGEESL